MLLIGRIIAIIVGLIVDLSPAVPGIKSCAVIIYTGIINTSLGLTVWNHVLRSIHFYEASILGASSIIFSTLLAVIILGERLTLNQISGMGFMVLGLALVQIRKGKLNVLYCHVFEHKYQLPKSSTREMEKQSHDQ